MPLKRNFPFFPALKIEIIKFIFLRDPEVILIQRMKACIRLYDSRRLKKVKKSEESREHSPTLRLSIIGGL